ncbi:MAG: DUF2244 domain-containing protein [Amaricoccus sp.]
MAVTLRPNRSLTPAMGTWLMALLAAGLAAPLVGLAGTKAAWGMLPFLIAAFAALYLAIRRNQRDGQLSEELKLWDDLITVVRREPRGRVLTWHANPFWVRVRLRSDAPVESYLTLQGNGREIELGAFLSPGEREALCRDLKATLAGLRTGVE